MSKNTIVSLIYHCHKLLDLICLEIGTSSIDWVQLSRFLSEVEDRIQSLKRVLNKKQDDGSKTNNCINIPLLQTFRSYLQYSKFIHLRSVPGEYQHFSSKNRGPSQPSSQTMTF
jgi:hypothetical protein